nr:MAG TPA: hypothetical protein [Caudoviricetes sp.]
MNGSCESLVPRRHHLPLSHTALLLPRETSHTHRGPQKRLERLWGPEWSGEPASRPNRPARPRMPRQPRRG